VTAAREIPDVIAEINGDKVVLDAMIGQALCREKNIDRVHWMRAAVLRGDDGQVLILAKNLCNEITNDIAEHARNVAAMRTAQDLLDPK
jgi:hypothetical protein